jgi:hypothetical protein
LKAIELGFLLRDLSPLARTEQASTGARGASGSS